MNEPLTDPAVKFKLRLTASWPVSRLKTQKITRELVWDNEADALACRDLMAKATLPKLFTVEFVRFTEEKPL